MAKHEFLTVAEGGYFYRFYPKIKQYKPSPREPVQRELFFAPLPDHRLTSHHQYLSGRFLTKYFDKNHFTVELQQYGHIIFNDHYTGENEKRELTSILVIHVPDFIYNHNYHKDKIYSIPVNDVIELP